MIKENLSIRLDEIFKYYKALLNRDRDTKNNFIVFSSNRTGSTLLLMLLKSHTEIHCKGEIFNKFLKRRFKKPLFPYLFIDGNNPKKNNTFGFLLKTQHISLVFSKKNKDIVSKLNKRGWKILYLKRLNIFRQAVSHLIATKNSKWHDFPSNSLEIKKVDIDCNKLLEILGWFEQLASKEKKVLEGLNYKTIIYEKHLLNEKNHQTTCDDISKYLGISCSKVNTNIRKISSNDLSNQITNYDEVLNFFRNTKYSKYLP